MISPISILQTYDFDTVTIETNVTRFWSQNDVKIISFPTLGGLRLAISLFSFGDPLISTRNGVGKKTEQFERNSERLSLDCTAERLMPRLYCRTFNASIVLRNI